MLNHSEYKSVDYKDSTISRRGFTLGRVGVLSSAIIYLVFVLTLVLLAKVALAAPVEVSVAVTNIEPSFIAENANRIIAAIIGLVIAVGFFVASKKEAHKLLR